MREADLAEAQERAEQLITAANSLTEKGGTGGHERREVHVMKAECDRLSLACAKLTQEQRQAQQARENVEAEAESLHEALVFAKAEVHRLEGLSFVQEEAVVQLRDALAHLEADLGETPHSSQPVAGDGLTRALAAAKLAQADLSRRLQASASKEAELHRLLVRRDRRIEELRAELRGTGARTGTGGRSLAGPPMRFSSTAEPQSVTPGRGSKAHSPTHGEPTEAAPVPQGRAPGLRIRMMLVEEQTRRAVLEMRVAELTASGAAEKAAQVTGSWLAGPSLLANTIGHSAMGTSGATTIGAGVPGGPSRLMEAPCSLCGHLQERLEEAEKARVAAEAERDELAGVNASTLARSMSKSTSSTLQGDLVTVDAASESPPASKVEELKLKLNSREEPLHNKISRERDELEQSTLRLNGMLLQEEQAHHKTKLRLTECQSQLASLKSASEDHMAAHAEQEKSLRDELQRLKALSAGAVKREKEGRTEAGMMTKCHTAQIESLKMHVEVMQEAQNKALSAQRNALKRFMARCKGIKLQQPSKGGTGGATTASSRARTKGVTKSRPQSASAAAASQDQLDVIGLLAASEAELYQVKSELSRLQHEYAVQSAALAAAESASVTASNAATHDMANEGEQESSTFEQIIFEAQLGASKAHCLELGAAIADRDGVVLALKRDMALLKAQQACAVQQTGQPAAAPKIAPAEKHLAECKKAHKAEVARLRQHIHNLESIRPSKDEVKQREDASKQAHTAIASLRAETGRKGKAIASLRASRLSDEQTLGALKKQVGEMQAELERVSRDVSAKSMVIKELRATRDDLQAKVQQRDHEIDQAKKDSGVLDVPALKANAKQLTATCERLRAQLSAQVELVEDAQRERDLLKNQVDSIPTLKADLARKTEAYKTMKTQLHSLKTELAELKDASQGSQAELEEKVRKLQKSADERGKQVKLEKSNGEALLHDLEGLKGAVKEALLSMYDEATPAAMTHEGSVRSDMVESLLDMTQDEVKDIMGSVTEDVRLEREAFEGRLQLALESSHGAALASLMYVLREKERAKEKGTGKGSTMTMDDIDTSLAEDLEELLPTAGGDADASPLSL
ncbi:unnamed protein product [Chrysoparadoxa australica]